MHFYNIASSTHKLEYCFSYWRFCFYHPEFIKMIWLYVLGCKIIWFPFHAFVLWFSWKYSSMKVLPRWKKMMLKFKFHHLGLQIWLVMLTGFCTCLQMPCEGLKMKEVCVFVSSWFCFWTAIETFCMLSKSSVLIPFSFLEKWFRKILCFLGGLMKVIKFITKVTRV